MPECDPKHPGIVPCIEHLPAVQLPATTLRLPELAALGGESIRATMMPSLGGRAELYQVTFDPQGRASLLAVWLAGHPYSGWREIGREEVVLTPREYRQLARRVDTALARTETPGGDEACLDGPGMRTERRRDGRTANYEAWGCGNEPGSVAFGVVAAFACRQIGRETATISIRRLCSYRIRSDRPAD